MSGLLTKGLASLAILVFTAGATPQKPYEVKDAAIVQVFCPAGTGTAFRISETKYVTAKHVVMDEGCVVNGEMITAVDRSDASDYATFQGPASKSVLKVSCRGFSAKRTYLAVGHGLGLELKMQIPWIATDYVNDGYRTFLGEGIPGMSGGPVLNKDGEAVGIVNLRWPARSRSLSDTPICE